MAGQGLVSMDEMTVEAVKRFPTGIAALDIVYGRTRFLKANRTDSGLPVGRVSLWSGEGGVGKTRLAITVTKMMNAMGARVLVGQGEVPPDQFGQWAGEVRRPKQYWVTDETTMDDLVARIDEVAPHIVVYDSVNMIEEITHRTKGKQRLQQFKDAVARHECHAILIGQLTADRKAKGGTDITHLVDVTASIYWYDSLPKRDRPVEPHTGRHRTLPGVFIFEIKKNRYVGCGRPDGWVALRHGEDGVVVFDSILSYPAEPNKGWADWVKAGMP